MKKNLLTLTLIASILSIILVLACNKNSEPRASQILTSKEQIADINGTNYCFTCGSSTNSDYGCRTFSGPNGSTYIACAPTSGDCYATHINQNITNNSLPYTPLNNTEMYSYRDGLLMNSNRGKTYITYYNLISQVMVEENGLNISNLLQHYSFAQKTINACNIIVNGNNTDVPFNTQYKNDAIALLNYYQTLSPNSYFTGVLSTITTDVIAVENMNRTQVIAYLNS